VNSEIGNITLLTWEGNFELDNVQLIIDPNIDGMFIDEEILKSTLKDMPELSCLYGSQFEVSIKLRITNKIPPHSFYVTIMPTRDFPEQYRKEGVGLILGRPWIELTNYPID